VTRSPAIDDATVAYIAEQHKHFEDLKQVAAQLAGLLVLAASGARTATADHPVLSLTDRLLGEAADAVRRTRAPVRARQHHEHLVEASAALERAWEEARRGTARVQGGLEIDSILTPLRAGYRCLQQAANALPGFEMVSFEQGCCSANLRSTIW